MDKQYVVISFRIKCSEIKNGRVINLKFLRRIDKVMDKFAFVYLIIFANRMARLLAENKIGKNTNSKLAW